MPLEGPPVVPPSEDVGGGVMRGLLVAAKTLPCGFGVDVAASGVPVGVGVGMFGVTVGVVVGGVVGGFVGRVVGGVVGGFVGGFVGGTYVFVIVHVMLSPAARETLLTREMSAALTVSV